MIYRLLSQEERSTFAPELMGTGHIIVTDGEKFWIVKQKNSPVDALKRDLLGFYLSSKIANVAEVKVLSDEGFLEIKTLTGKDETANPTNTFLVRLGGNYKVDELVHKNPEDAVASELVYSTWVRRRDTHVDNRSYVEGIPIFFDHETSFLLEPHFAHSTIFFRAAPDYGHASFWRVKQIDGKMTIQEARAVDRSQKGSYHYVNDIMKFKTSLDTYKKRIQEVFENDFTEDIRRAGFSDNETGIIYAFLRYNLTVLDHDLKLMEEVIYKQ